eukprot:241405-Rhodomonas_salina.3
MSSGHTRADTKQDSLSRYRTLRSAGVAQYSVHAQHSTASPISPPPANHAASFSETPKSGRTFQAFRSSAFTGAPLRPIGHRARDRSRAR